MDGSILIQAKVFLLSVLYGIFIVCAYDGWRTFWQGRQKVKKENRITDTVFWSFAGVALFLFVEWGNQGNIRGYLFLGWMIGILIYQMIIKAYLRRLWIWLVRMLKNIKKAVKMTIGRR